MVAGETTPLIDAEAAAGICCVRTRRSATVLVLVLLTLHVILREASSQSVPSLLPEIDADGFQHALRHLPGIGKFGSVLGKLATIFIIDAFGVRAVLGTSAMVSGTAMILMSLCSPASWPWPAMIWAVSTFCNAMVWGSGSRIVASWADAAFLGRGVMVFGLAYDFGDVFATLFYSTMSAVTTWRVCFAVVGSLYTTQGVIGAMLLRGRPADAGFEPASRRGSGSGSGTDGARAPHPFDALSLSSAVCLLCSLGRTWIGVLTNIGFGVYDGFMEYVTSYATSELGYSTSAADLLLTLASLSSSAGTLAAGAARDLLPPRATRTLALAVSACFVAVCGALLTAQLSGQLGAMSWLLPLAVLVGRLSVGVQWNVMLTVWALELSGPRHASTLMGMMDVLSSAAAVPSAFWIGNRAAAGDWGSALLPPLLAGAVGHLGINLINFVCVDLPPPSTATTAASDSEVGRRDGTEKESSTGEVLSKP